MKIDLPISDRTGKWTMAKATIVPIAPHLSGAFAVHLCPWAREVGYRRWCVSNVETGTLVYASAWMGRDGVIEAAKSLLADRTDRQLWAAMRKADKIQKQYQQGGSLPVTPECAFNLPGRAPCDCGASYRKDTSK